MNERTIARRQQVTASQVRRLSALALSAAVSLAGAQAMAKEVSANPEGTKEQAAYDQLQREVIGNQDKYFDLIDQLEETIEEAKKRLGSLGQEKAALEGEIKSAQHEVFELRMKREERRGELKDLQDETASLSRSLEKQRYLMTRLEKKLEQMTAKIPSYENAMHAARLLREKDETLKDLQEKHARAVEEKLELEERVAAKEQSLRNLESTSRAAVNRYSLVEKKLEEGQAVREAQREEIAELRRQLKAAEEASTRRDKELASARDAEERVRQALRGSELAIADLTARLEVEEGKSEDADKRTRDASGMVSALERKLERALREGERATDAVQQRENELKQLRDALEKARREKKSAVAEAQSSRELLEKLLMKHQELLGTLERVRDNLVGPSADG